MDHFLSFIAAASTLSTTVFLVLWILERRKNRQFRLAIETERSTASGSETAILRLSQALNFRDGGVGYALIAFRRCVDSVRDWVPELLADPNMVHDITRVDRFLQHLLKNELVNSSQRKLMDSMGTQTATARPSQSQSQ